MITMQYGRGSDTTGSAALDRVDYTSQISLSQGTAHSSMSLVRYGKLVVWNFAATGVSTTSSYATKATIPAEVAPPSQQIFNAVMNASNGIAQIATDGTLMLRVVSGSQSNVATRFLAMWVLE